MMMSKRLILEQGEKKSIWLKASRTQPSAFGGVSVEMVRGAQEIELDRPLLLGHSPEDNG
jgi:hypothetical protein